MMVDKLARILAEEFERDNWGAIEPSLFGHVADIAYADDKKEQLDEMDDESRRDIEGMEQVLRRVLSRLDGGG